MGGTKGGTGNEALVAELREMVGTASIKMLNAALCRAADALARQQAVVEAARTIRESLRGDGWSEADLQTMARPGMADLMKALVALDAPPEGEE